MINSPLKILSFFTAFAGIHGAVPVRAAVNMISIEHRVGGYAGESPTNFYDEAGPVPLSRSISYNMWDDDYDIDRDGPWLGEWYRASSSASLWSIYADRDGFGHLASAYAQNTYIFKPLSRELSISLRGVISIWWFENDAQMTLTDRSTNSLVSVYQSPSYFHPNGPFPEFFDDTVEFPINWDTTVEVDPGHEYELIIYVAAHRGEGGNGAASLMLAPIPEPGSTLLAGMAVLLICVRRQRQQA